MTAHEPLDLTESAVLARIEREIGPQSELWRRGFSIGFACGARAGMDEAKRIVSGAQPEGIE